MSLDVDALVSKKERAAVLSPEQFSLTELGVADRCYSDRLSELLRTDESAKDELTRMVRDKQLQGSDEFVKDLNEALTKVNLGEYRKENIARNTYYKDEASKLASGSFDQSVYDSFVAKASKARKGNEFNEEGLKAAGWLADKYFKDVPKYKLYHLLDRFALRNQFTSGWDARDPEAGVLLSVRMARAGIPQVASDMVVKEVDGKWAVVREPGVQPAFGIKERDLNVSEPEKPVSKGELREWKGLIKEREALERAARKLEDVRAKKLDDSREEYASKVYDKEAALLSEDASRMEEVMAARRKEFLNSAAGFRYGRFSVPDVSRSLEPVGSSAPSSGRWFPGMLTFMVGRVGKKGAEWEPVESRVGSFNVDSGEAVARDVTGESVPVFRVIASARALVRESSPFSRLRDRTVFDLEYRGSRVSFELGDTPGESLRRFKRALAGGVSGVGGSLPFGTGVRSVVVDPRLLGFVPESVPVPVGVEGLSPVVSEVGRSRVVGSGRSGFVPQVILDLPGRFSGASRALAEESRLRSVGRGFAGKYGRLVSGVLSDRRRDVARLSRR